MFDLRKPAFLPLSRVNRAVAAALAVFVLTLAGGRAFAQDTPSGPAAAPAEAPPPAAPAEASEAKPAAPEEATKVEAAPPAPPAPCPEVAPPAPPAPPPGPTVEWKAQSKGGFIMTSGNSQATNVNFGVNGSRKEGNNKLELLAGVAYGRTKNLVATTDAAGVIQSLDRQSVVSTNNWATKGRYDRFLSENNIAYASTQWAGDKIAGKTLFGGGQAGYSRQVRKDKWNLVLAELGYDFSYERYVQQSNKTIDPVTIHSARLLVGETLSLTPATGLTASVEALLNLNHETKAINAKTGFTGVDAFHDTRINGKLGISTNLFKKLALGLTFTVKYDQNPAPRPVPSVVVGAPAGTPISFPAPPAYFSWESADKVDTLTEVNLLYSFF
jgi:hypothetical protein